MLNRPKNLEKLLDDIDAGKRTSPLKAIRAYCLECVGWSSDEVKNCTCNNQKETRCFLYKYRFGKNESGKRLGRGKEGKPFPKSHQ